MEKPLTALNLYQSTKILDISYLPTRIQDIPKDILKLYGLVVVDEEFVNEHVSVPSSEKEEDDVDDDSDPGVLVIDEAPDVKQSPALQIHVRVKKKHGIADTTKFQKEPSSLKIPNINLSSSNTIYCKTCQKLVAYCTEEQHRRSHCDYSGCPELIHSEEEREKHNKIHSYPGKPIQCRFCKKRYRFYSYLERHFPYCKGRKAAEAREFMKKLTENYSSL